MQFPFLFFVGYAEGGAEGVQRQHYLLFRLEAVPSKAGAQSCTPSEALSYFSESGSVKDPSFFQKGFTDANKIEVLFWLCR
jgi:hypothetical protein